MSNSNSPQATNSPIEFGTNPSVIKIPANSVSVMLNVIAKLKNSYTLECSQLEKSLSESDALGADDKHQLMRSNTMRKARPEKYNHLLIAKIKDTQIMFSFFIEASIIECKDQQSSLS